MHRVNLFEFRAVSNDDDVSHFLPTNFNHSARRLIATPTNHLTPPVSTSESLVETMVIQSALGIEVTLVNWRPEPVNNLQVQIDIPVPATATLAGRGKLSRSDDGKTFTLDLDVADVLVLREN